MTNSRAGGNIARRVAKTDVRAPKEHALLRVRETGPAFERTQNNLHGVKDFCLSEAWAVPSAFVGDAAALC